MLRITQRALAELRGILELGTEDVAGSERTALRLVSAAEEEAAEDAPLALIIDKRRDGDEVVSDGDQAVLFVDGRAADLLQGLVLDVVEGEHGRQLMLQAGSGPQGPM